MRLSSRCATPLLIVALSLFSAACRTGGVAASVGAQAILLRREAERLGVPVRTERFITISQGDATMLTAPAAGLEAVPATELPRGVNVAVAYLNAPEQEFPAGFYTLRAFAQPREPGTVEGRVQIIDANQTVVREVPARFEILSMTLPDRPERLFTSVLLNRSRTVAPCNPAYETCFCCTNGWIVCSTNFFRPRVPDIRVLQ